ncbi:conserved alanine and proline rich domain protein [Mycobacterium kansasii 824]|nr:conserved alanine and proline rich domain protein [Mycobacterium kansasii 824]
MATTLAIGQNPGVAPLAVDPEAMFVAGSAVAAVGEDLVAALGTLTAGFGPTLVRMRLATCSGWRIRRRRSRW